MSWVFQLVMPAGWNTSISGDWAIGAGAWVEEASTPVWFWNATNGRTVRAIRFVREVGRSIRDYEALSINPLDLPDTWSRVDIVAMLSRRDVFSSIPGAAAVVIEDGTTTLSIDLADDYEREYGVCLACLVRRGTQWELALDGTGFHQPSEEQPTAL
ncbi:MAG: hypothetical protein KGR25_12270 [Chloroflexi bacterium]|jgi:stress response protein SCP2|nr:hypothetical protein [Chloroflexota bacterium]